jgi:phosphatidylserine/phosphatidylglycerophosphate/cardiolipin synthase-like enzyme
MNTADLDRILAMALTDHRIQAGEHKALSAWAARHVQDDAGRAVARSRAFAIARSMAADRPDQILNWLEDVIRVFARPATPAGAPDETAVAYFSPGKACISEVIRQFDTAADSCDVCVFTITDDRITNAIIRAHGRGVRVRVITDDAKAHDLGSDVDKLQFVGIPCKMDHGNEAHMHHKFAVFDRKRLMTGSFNWTRSASEDNEENLIVTPDANLVAAFSARFEALWSRMRE